MALLGRIFIILFGLFCAGMAASAVLTIAVLAREWNDLLVLSWEVGTLSVVIGLGGLVITGVALVPVLLAVAFAEAYGWRSVLFYAGLGLVLALWAYYGGYELQDVAFARDGEISAAAGIAGGMVYWLIAGRRAGAWRAGTAQERVPRGEGSSAPHE